MPGRKAARLLVGLSAAIAVLGMAVSADAQEKKIKIGVIYDLTGPLAGGGSELQYIGAKIMLDQYAKTGVEGYKVEAVYADAQSKPDVAINEAVRLIQTSLMGSAAFVAVFYFLQRAAQDLSLGPPRSVVVIEFSDLSRKYSKAVP